MAALLTVDELRTHVDTDLTDEALQRLLDDADADIVTRYGEHTTAIETVITNGSDQYVFTDRRVVSVTTVVETIRNAWGTEQTSTLAADDYTLTGLRTLRRRPDGTNGRSTWGQIVTITYEPDADADRRKRVTIDLVKLALRYTASSSEGLGDLSVSHVDYQRERERILKVLQPTIMGGFA